MVKGECHNGVVSCIIIYISFLGVLLSGGFQLEDWQNFWHWLTL